MSVKLANGITTEDGRDTIWIHPVPSKPIAVRKAVRVGRMTVMLDENGTVYSDGISSRLHFDVGHQSGVRFADFFTALRKLGVLTAAQIREHLAVVKRKHDDYERRNAAKIVAKYAPEVGIKLTKAQIAQIERTMESEKGDPS